MKHDDLELDLFGNSVLDDFIEFYVLITACLFLYTFVRFSQQIKTTTSQKIKLFAAKKN